MSRSPSNAPESRPEQARQAQLPTRLLWMEQEHSPLEALARYGGTQRVAGHPRFVLSFTPTSSSWLNLVKRWFSELSSQSSPTRSSVAEHTAQSVNSTQTCMQLDRALDRKPAPTPRPRPHSKSSIASAASANESRLRTLERSLRRPIGGAISPARHPSSPRLSWTARTRRYMTGCWWCSRSWYRRWRK